MKVKEKVLEDAYNWVIDNFSSERYNLVLQFLKQLYVSDKQLMGKKQFAQCTLQNRILIKLLIESGQFRKEDIQKKWRPFRGIHQYLIVNVDGKKFKIDPFYRIFEGID
jgi:hypothetical protein